MKIVTPVSHLFKIHSDLIIENSDMLEIRDYVTLPNYTEDFYHSDLNILAEWDKEEVDRLEDVSNKHKNLIGTSFHILSRYQKNKQIEMGLKPIVGVGEPMTEKEMILNSDVNCSIVRKIFGEDIIIMVENINHLLTDAYDKITEPEFIKSVVEDNGVFLLLDIAHAEITCVNKKKNFNEYLRALPLDKCLQVHISKLGMEYGKAYDAHEELLDIDWEKTMKIIKLTKNARFITLEYYKDINILIRMLKRLRKELKLG